MRFTALSSLLVALVTGACGGDPETDPGAGNWPEDAKGPAGTGAGVRVFSGSAATLSTSRSCSAEEGAPGDRWCAFVARSSAGDDQLYVVNVSQVIAGVPVACGAPDPNCLLLTESLGASSPDFHRTYFAGDTLVYYDRELAARVWRPGMAAGRLLASREGMRDIAFCSPAPRGTAVACLSFPFEQPDGTMVVAELLAGAADGETEPLLSPVESVIAATLEDTPQVHRFGFGTLADGHVVWSSREEPDGPELLKLQRVGDDASRITVASDVHQWAVTGEGSGWLWVRETNDFGVGTLQAARFPEGDDPVDLLADVFTYELTPSGGTVAVTAARQAVAIADPIGAPHAQVPLDDDVGQVVSLSEGGHVAYTKGFKTGIYDLLVSSLDGERSCVLETAGGFSPYVVAFSPGAETVLWARRNEERYDGYHSDVFGCRSAPLSPGVVELGWVGSGHAVFLDAFDPVTGSGSLRFRRAGKDGELHPDPPSLIAEQADGYAVWGPNYLLYTVSAGSDADGLYVRAFGN